MAAGNLKARPLVEHRKRALLTIRELAQKAHVSTATIVRIEQANYQVIHFSTMRSIAQALVVRPEEVEEFAKEMGIDEL